MPNSRIPRRLLAVAAAAALVAAAGCAPPPPKLVVQITSARDQIKFLYVQGSGQGVLKCQVAPDGALNQCRDIVIAIDD